jgi:hypothetical protein
MAVIALACFIVAAILFLVAAFGIGRPRVELSCLGLFFLALAGIVLNWPGA